MKRHSSEMIVKFTPRLLKNENVRGEAFAENSNEMK
jgi:hypothetical protein